MSRQYCPAPHVDVRTDERGRPVALTYLGTTFRGEARGEWRVRTGWWQGEEIWRDCYLWEGDEMLCEVYRDKRSGDWRLLRVYSQEAVGEPTAA
jgi:hypothetical protein